MNKTIKKLVCAIITAVFLSSVFTGFLFKNTANTKNNISSNFDVSKAEEMKLKLWTTQGTDATPDTFAQGADNVVQNWLTQKTKVTFAPEDIYGNSGQNWEGKLVMLAAGGDLPDVAYTGVNGINVIQKLVDGNKAWELTPELLKKYAPNIWAQTTKAEWAFTTIKGKNYGIPGLFEVSKALDPKLSNDYLYGVGVPGTNSGTDGGVWAIRDDISKKLFPKSKTYNELNTLLLSKGNNASAEDLLDIPLKTKDAVVKMFYDIKKLGLKENGKDMFAIAYPAGDSYALFSNLIDDFMGTWTKNQFTQFNLNTRKITFGMQQPLYKEFGLIINKMVRDKVMDPESLMLTPAQLTQDMLAGKYAVINLERTGMNYDTANAELAKEGKSFRYRPFITQVPVNIHITPYIAPPTSYGSMVILKTDTVKSEEQLAQVLNYYDVQYTKEFQEIQQWGPKELGLYKEVNGKREFVDEKLNNVILKGLKDPTVTEKYRKGLAEVNQRQFSLYLVNPYAANILNKEFVPTIVNVIYNKKFNLNSKYAIKQYGPGDAAWDNSFAGVPDVAGILTGWQTNYDNAFKIALASGSDEEFNAKWAAAEKILSTIATPKLLQSMTDIANKNYANIKANTNLK
jgi:putative aldouronate transport system substrate-binding protein